MLAIYRRGTDGGGPVGLLLIPASREADLVQRREHLDNSGVLNLPLRWQPIVASEVDLMVQVAVREQGPTSGFAQGRTMRNTPSTISLCWQDQTVTTDDGTTRVRTFLAGAEGLEVEHVLEHREGAGYLTCFTTVRNAGSSIMTLDAISSFSLGGLTPFARDDAPGRLRSHRFRSAWSAEARAEVRTFEELNLEPSWTGHASRSERFGALGSMPLNGWIPVAAVEDVMAGVTWAASLDVAGTWQMEFYRRKDEAAFSGGLGDREFGHWWKALQPGESFSAPRAWVTVTDQPVALVWDRLLESYGEESGPASEEACPVIFNEWCTSWGNPTHKNLIEVADRLRGSGVRHLVIDDGWAERPPEALAQSNGDWIVNKTAFPEGLEGTVRELRERDIDPGIWFEFEVVNPGTAAWSQTSHMLHRDGQVLQVGSRRFWDFRDPWVHEYLAEKVVGLLRDNGFRYLKVDYNDTIGLGVDGAESPGEGLRQHLEGVVAFFKRMRQEIPELVIENCSSGGHRHSAPFLRCCAMSSFSDAHETPDIPIITANLLPVVPRQKLQVWAVLRKSDSARRLHYSLAAAFLGRMCLSGDLHELNAEQWATTQRAIHLYRDLAANLVKGTCQRHGSALSSYNHPEGWQAVLRIAGDECIVIAHSFANAPKQIRIPRPEGNWQIRDIFAEQPEKFLIDANQIVWDCAGDFAGIVARLCKI